MRRLHVASFVLVVIALSVNNARADDQQGRLVEERGWSIVLGPEWVAQRDGTFVGSYGKPNRGLMFYSILDLPQVRTLAQLKDHQVQQWKAANLKVTGTQETKIAGRPVAVVTLTNTYEQKGRDVYGREYNDGIRTNRMVVLLFLTSQGPGGWALEAGSADADLKGYLQTILATLKLR